MAEITTQEWIDRYVDAEMKNLVNTVTVGDLLEVLEDIGEGSPECELLEDIAIDLRKGMDYDPSRVGRLLHQLFTGYYNQLYGAEAAGRVPDNLE